MDVYFDEICENHLKPYGSIFFGLNKKEKTFHLDGDALAGSALTGLLGHVTDVQITQQKDPHTYTHTLTHTQKQSLTHR